MPHTARPPPRDGATQVPGQGRAKRRRLLEEDKRPDHDVLAASRVGGGGRVDAGAMERPARDRAVGHRVIALEHRDLGRLLLRDPVPLVPGAVSEPRGLADAVVVDTVIVDVWLVSE